MADNETSTFEQLIGGCLMAAFGLYIVVGLMYAAGTADWPPFWPPMDIVIAPLEIVSTPASVVGMAMMYGAVVVVLGPLLLLCGARRVIRCWKHRARLFH